MEEPGYNLAEEEVRRTAIQSRMTWGDYIFWGICAGVVVAVIVFVGLFFWGVHASFDAELNMQTTRFVIRLVEKFVKDHRRWPASWQELEATKPPNHNQSEQLAVMIGPWPSCAEDVKRRVTINFHADLKDIVSRDRMLLEAIKPIRRHYEYRDYGDVDELQLTLRSRVPGLNK